MFFTEVLIALEKYAFEQGNLNNSISNLNQINISNYLKYLLYNNTEFFNTKTIDNLNKFKDIYITKNTDKELLNILNLVLRRSTAANTNTQNTNQDISSKSLDDFLILYLGKANISLSTKTNICNHHNKAHN